MRKTGEREARKDRQRARQIDIQCARQTDRQKQADRQSVNDVVIMHVV